MCHQDQILAAYMQAMLLSMKADFVGSGSEATEVHANFLKSAFGLLPPGDTGLSLTFQQSLDSWRISDSLESEQ